jgi:ribosomal protein S18 acetylase RimI-like enzyme
MNDIKSYTNALSVISFEPRHAAAFRDLNLEWIERYFVVELSDRELLDDPQREIIDRGGEIFVVEDSERVVGVCALIALEDGAFKLGKMAVSPAAQGRGLGRLLANAAIARARERNAPYVELFTNHVLGPAISLYESVGFRHVPMEKAEHERSNVRMMLRF